MKVPGLLLFSTSLALAQTPAADQAAKAYKTAHDKLSVKHEADMGKKTGDKEKMEKAYLKEVEKLDARYLPVILDEIGLAQKEGDAPKEQALKQTLEKVFGTKVGTVALRGSYFLQISGTVGNAHSGSTIYRVAIDKD